MNCLEFRRACLVDPLSREPAFRAHASQCPTCQHFLREQLEQEQQLRVALTVDLPDELAARVLLRQSFARRARVPLALAATVVLGVAAGVIGYFLNRPLPLEAAVMEHIRAEPDHLASPVPEKTDKLATVLKTLGARIEGEPGEVRYAGVCDIGKRPGAHLVLRGERGPVTVLLLPRQTLHQTVRIHDRGLEGVVLPIDGGSVAYIGMPGEPIDSLTQRLRVQFHEPRV